MKQALFHGAIVQDLNKQPLPPPHPELLKYFNPPRKVVKRARRAIEAAKDAFDVKEGERLLTASANTCLPSKHSPLVPKRVVRNRKDGHVRARDDGDDTLLLDKQPNKRIKLSRSQSRAPAGVSPDAQRTAAKKATDDDSETEPEDDEQDLILDQKPARGTKDGSAPTDDEPLPTPSQSPAPDDDGRAPGRIIGSSFPLEDFRKNIATGDLVTKAVEDLAFVIRTIVLRPFSTKRVDEMVECAAALRKVCLEVSEIRYFDRPIPHIVRMFTPGRRKMKLRRGTSMFFLPCAAREGRVWADTTSPLFLDFCQT